MPSASLHLRFMNVVEGGNEPDAHLHRRIMPECDWCGASLAGRMPNPFWVARPASGRTDEFGHPVAEDATVRVYLCKQHRLLMTKALDHALHRELHRKTAGQKMFPDNPSVKPI